MDQRWTSLHSGPSVTSTTSESSSLPAYAPGGADPSFPEAYEKQVNLELQRDFPEADLDQASAKADEPFISPEHASPGVASESTLRRGLQIPTRSRTITSGFPYVEALADANVGEQEWAAFTSEITRVARMRSDQWTTAIGKGLGTLVVGGLIVGVMGIIPAAIVTRLVRKRTESQNVQDARREGAELQLLIEHWNETYFRPRGILLRIDLPGESEDIDEMDVSTSKSYQRARVAEKTGQPQSGIGALDETRARGKAVRRGRIVILPLEILGGDTPEQHRLKAQSDKASSEISAYEAKTGTRDHFPAEPKP